MKHAAKNHKKKRLSILCVELKSAPNNKDIYDINFLLQSKIKFKQSHARSAVML